MNMMDGAFTQQNRKETTAPFGVNLNEKPSVIPGSSVYAAIWFHKLYLTNL